MDISDNAPTQIVPPDDEITKSFKNPLSSVHRITDEKHRQCVSLPVFLDQVSLVIQFISSNIKVINLCDCMRPRKKICVMFPKSNQ